MIKRFTTFAVGLTLASSAHAVDGSVRRQLEALSPEERIEQRCDMEAMEQIGGARKGFRPDKVIAYAFGDPKQSEDLLKTRGAVFRSKGEWYRLAYRCETTADGLDIRSFKFKIGERVPREDWQAHYLYD
ncbi:DUF930 domain-containing protein [Sinorhizobium sp. BG8]|uniref:DUF930 domain-containing protein n=1 Tax=Sinorhizobium sp. BG8 TaxID=2613773 RepID=UPI00193DDA05|nr:DUF930 domain-containing protein [Sinorhizobium sp. BG8]QRM54684.1 DUF930 domain-containing protein [Sinorhizobium sp. BG8]